MNNPFDLLKLYHVAQLQEHLLTEDTNNNFDFSTLLSENDNIRKYSSTRSTATIISLKTIKNSIESNDFKKLCEYLVLFLKENLILDEKLLSLPDSLKTIIVDSDNGIILVHMMSAYFNLAQDNKRSSRTIISDYLKIVQNINEQDSRTPKEALEQLKRNISACSIFPYLNEAAGYTAKNEKITANWIERNLFNSITDNLMLDIFLTHNKKSLPFQAKYLNEQDVDLKYKHVNRIHSYQYQLEQLNLLLDGCKVSLIATNSDTNEQKINKLISQYTFEIMTNANYLYLTSIMAPILKNKESKAHNEITNYLLDRFYVFISLLSLLPYPRLQRSLLTYFFDKHFKFFKPIINYYEVHDKNIEDLFKTISKKEIDFREMICKIIEEINTKNSSLEDVSIFKAIDDANNIIIPLLRYSLLLEEYLQTYIELEKNKSEEFFKTIQGYLLHELARHNDIFLYESNHEHILPSVFYEFMEANNNHYHFDKKHFFDILPKPNNAHNKSTSDNRPEYQNIFARHMSNNFALTFPAISAKFRTAESIFLQGEIFINRYNLR